MNYTKERHDAKRLAILNAAISALKNKGTRGFRIRDVGARAGRSKSAVHYYYIDEDTLLVECYRELLRQETSLLASNPEPYQLERTYLPLLRDVEAKVGREIIAGELKDELAAYHSLICGAWIAPGLTVYLSQLLPPCEVAQ